MPNGITLGSDPELIFVNQYGLVEAAEYFERQGNHNGNNPEIGGDGHPATAELRTPVCSSPTEVVDSIEDILRRNYQEIPQDISWVAGSFVEGKAIGGHIHFGIKPTDHIVAACDALVAPIVILMEDKWGSRRRRAGEYGALGDIREKKWGFEYRPLPSWIVSKQIALGVVSLATAAVFEEATKGPNALINLRGNKLRKLIDVDRRNFRLCDKAYFMERFQDLFDHVCQLDYWRTLEGAALKRNLGLLRYIITNHPDWHNGKDILERWGIRKTPVPYKVLRGEIRPVINLEEVLKPDAAWDRLLNR